MDATVPQRSWRATEVRLGTSHTCDHRELRTDSRGRQARPWVSGARGVARGHSSVSLSPRPVAASALRGWRAPPPPHPGPARAGARPEQRPGPSRRRSVNSPRVWISREVPPGSQLAGGGGDSAEADGLVWGEGTRFCTSFLHR